MEQNLEITCFGMYCIAIPTNLLDIRYSHVHLYVIMFINNKK